jgi:hypothetical protein
MYYTIQTMNVANNLHKCQKSFQLELSAQSEYVWHIEDSRLAPHFTNALSVTVN